jgi:hypothetical protein
MIEHSDLECLSRGAERYVPISSVQHDRVQEVEERG